MAVGASFRSQPTPSYVRPGRGQDSNLDTGSMPGVERSADSPRDVHNSRRDMQRQGLPGMRVLSRSRSRDRSGRSGSLTREEEQAAGVSHSFVLNAFMLSSFDEYVLL